MEFLASVSESVRMGTTNAYLSPISATVHPSIESAWQWLSEEYDAGLSHTSADTPRISPEDMQGWTSTGSIVGADGLTYAVGRALESGEWA